MHVGTHVEVLGGELDVAADLGREHELMPEALQMNAQDLTHLQNLAVLDSVSQFLAFFAAVHVVALELVG